MSDRKLVILLAEDDPGDRIPVAAYLRSKGHKVVEAVNPAQTIRCLEAASDRIDAIVLDLIMPEDDPKGGEKVLEYMNHNDIMVPVILATAWGYNGPAEEARQIHPKAVKKVMTKTFLPAELHDEVVNAVKGTGNGSKSKAAAK
ncbi:hypothetical protein LCGC14_1619010 [marine sediment metagenome]|uniref:Response regulatory domain-containing protein n=1 Tax=marine sediment metagenome TaxID=412755 RepID=A0A0F9ISZ1_9ZZZZ